MKKFLFLLTVIAFIGCNNEKSADAPGTTAAKANVPANMFGFTPNYSASFIMDDASNTETVLSLWKDWKDGDLSKSRPHFADSLSFFLPDGNSMSGKTDDILKGMQDYRNSFKGMEVNVDAIFAVKSTDKNEDWVAVWGSEVQTSMDGKVDSISIQETWRFNTDGKIDMMMQSLRKGITPPPPVK